MERTTPPDDGRPARLSPEERSYFEGIEAHFIRRRGRPLILSPRELKRAADWHGEGIPLAVVCRGIDRYFERKKGQRARERAVTLEYCEPYVREAFEEHRRLAVGGPSGGLSAGRDVLVEGLSRLRERLEASLRHGRGGRADLDDRLRRALEEVQALAGDAGVLDVETVEARLEPLNREVAGELLRRAEGPDLEELRRSCAVEISAGAPEMSPELLDETVERLVLGRLRQRYAVPEITLFSI